LRLAGGLGHTIECGWADTPELIQSTLKKSCRCCGIAAERGDCLGMRFFEIAAQIVELVRAIELEALVERNSG